MKYCSLRKVQTSVISEREPPMNLMMVIMRLAPS